MSYYKSKGINREALRSLGRQTFGSEPFDWQIDTAEAVLEGRDVVLDVGTGSGKTLAFTLALVLDKEDIALVVSPLSSLMIEQMKNALISTIAVCHETFEHTSKEDVYRDICEGKYRRVIVSPEIAISQSFGVSVLSKKKLQTRLRCFIIDEAHCIVDWGSSFRTDYSKIGVLRGRVASNVPFVVASATLPTHVLEVVRKEVNLDAQAAVISLSNERRNIALSTREMQFEESSRADLLFTIPRNAREPQDIPITLIYVNLRKICEEIYDRLKFFSPVDFPEDTIAFYHSQLGSARKRALEERLRVGQVRILICTDAVGMGCDLRNIERVVLWDLPYTFCSLVQRIGRAARDMSRSGEAILIVCKGTRRKGVTAADVKKLQSLILSDNERLISPGDSDEDVRMEIENVVEASGHKIRCLDDGGRRVERTDEGEREEAVEGSNRPKPRKKAETKIERLEKAYLTLYANTSSCLRKVWDMYFENNKKPRLVYKKNTLYKHNRQARCCSNCSPADFPMEDIELEKRPGLKRGRRTTASKAFSAYAKKRLIQWRKSLFERLYPGIFIITAESLLDTDIIEKLASQGNRISSATDMLTRVRWSAGTESIEGPSPTPNEHGRSLFIELQDIYNEYDKTHPVDQDTEDELDDKEDEGLDGTGGGGEKSRPTAAGRQIRVQTSGSQIKFVISAAPSE